MQRNRKILLIQRENNLTGTIHMETQILRLLVKVLNMLSEPKGTMKNKLKEIRIMYK